MYGSNEVLTKQKAEKLLALALKLVKVFRSKADLFLSGQEELSISISELRRLNFMLDIVCQETHADGSIIVLPETSDGGLLDASTLVHDFVQQIPALKVCHFFLQTVLTSLTLNVFVDSSIFKA